MGQAHRRPHRRDRGQARPAHRQDPGDLWHRQGCRREAGRRMAGPTEGKGKTMNTPLMKLATAAVVLAFSACASAATPLMSKAYYEASKARIEADATAAKDGCKAFVGNAKDVCMAEAKGREKIARAQLEEAYQPSD